MGLAATEQLAQIAGIERGTTILDAGSGLGGPSRYLVSTYGCRVIGADLSPSFAAVAQVLAQRTGLDALVIYQVADLAKKRVALEDADSDCLFPNLLRRADFRSTDEVDLNWLQHNGVLNLPSRSSYCCNQKIV